jgi:putative flippase GtrA
MNLRELGRFGFVGVVQNCLNIAIFGLAIAVGAQYLVAAGLAAGAALTVSYVMNRTWTFRGVFRGTHGHELPRYVVAFGCAVLLGIAILAVLVEGVGMPELLAQGVSILIVAPLSYFAQRTWIFRRSAA